MKPILKISIGTSALIFSFLAIAVSDNQEIFLESKESKTMGDRPVFNKIKLFQFKDRDVWMMNQSHHGIKTELWDRLAIVVDKTQNPKTAKFYQFEPGPLEWQENLPERPFKVSCYMCHNNGPRAIRPNYESPLNPTTFKDKIKISYWNLKMKFYGRILPHPSHDAMDLSAEKPFRFHSAYENETLKVKTCMKCHKESGLFARGSLHRQQTPTIKFMLESGEMPPPGFSLSFEEKVQIEKFLEGF